MLLYNDLLHFKMSPGLLGALLEGADSLVAFLLVQPAMDCHDLPAFCPRGLGLF